MIRAVLLVVSVLLLSVGLSVPVTGASASATRQLAIQFTQVPTTLNPHFGWIDNGLGGGTNTAASRLVLEPLAAVSSTGELVPTLAATVPTLTNGGISADGRVVTWHLRRGVRWSDGTPFTADDVVFTWTYMADPATGAATAAFVSGVASVTATDAHTVVVQLRSDFRPRSGSPWAGPYTFGVGSAGAILQRAQFAPFMGAGAQAAPPNFAPIGTGPYVVQSFNASGVTYRLNDKYRARRPYFRAVAIVAAATPVAAATAVLQDGTADYASNVGGSGIDALRSLLALGKGAFVSATGHAVERVVINRSDPAHNSELAFAHPFFTDVRVRTAFAMAIDRDAMVQQLYGAGVLADRTCSLLTGAILYESPNTSTMAVCRYDIPAANALLDAAGWTARDIDGVRIKDGVRLHVQFQTTQNAIRVRQFNIMAAGWRAIGVDIAPIRQIDAGTFFTRHRDPRSVQRFLADLEMFNNSGRIDPESYLVGWLSTNIPQASNNWNRDSNYARFVSPEYDALYERLHTAVDPTTRAAIAIQMNDLLVREVVEIPLFARRGPNAVRKSTLLGTAPSAWDDETWNIATWRFGNPSSTDDDEGAEQGDDKD